MTREARIVETFVELVDTMASDFEAVDFLHRLTERTVELLDCQEAGLVLADAAGVLRVMASSSEATTALELLQLQSSQGPCFEAYQNARAVHSTNLATDLGRWPTFAPAAVSRGFLSVHAFPMRAHGETIGALNLFRTVDGPLRKTDMPVAQGMADVAAIGITQERALRASHTTVTQLQGALRSRIVLEQAKGVLAERLRISVDEAFNKLRNQARSTNRQIGEVARDIVEGKLSARDVADAPSDRRRHSR